MTTYEIQDGTLREVADPPERVELVQVVRCRDCKYASYDLRWCYWPINSAELPVRPDGYCAWGEKK